jgi:aryl-alcohol dehydrogenase-like predicted oxidoreductase
VEYRQLGGSGLQVPVLALGTATFAGGDSERSWGNTLVDEATRLVDLALAAGVTLFDTADVMDEIAAETGKTLSQIALNWLLQRPTVSSIIFGARNEEQLRENFGAVGWNLTAEQIAKLDAASANTPIYPYWHQLNFAERNPFPTL